MRNVESSTSSSEAAALCDVTATTRKPATKRMSQGATQHKRGKTDGEEKSTIPNASSGCLLQALKDADVSQGETQHKRGKTDGEENNTIPNAPSGCLLQALKDADDAFSPKRMRQRATQQKRGETNSEEESPIKT